MTVAYNFPSPVLVEAYKASLEDLTTNFDELTACLDKIGRTTPGGLDNVTTKNGKKLSEVLDGEPLPSAGAPN